MFIWSRGARSAPVSWIGAGARIGGAIWLAAVGSRAQAEPVAVLELFTSQGCSSCPAADQLIAGLARDPNLLVLSIPITYWDYLGWKDTLALPQHTARQKAYMHVRADRNLYTPQVVVSGQWQVLGNDKAAVEAAVARAREHGALSVPVAARREGGQLAVSVDGGQGSGSAEVWLCGLVKSAQVAVARGENRGRTLVYANVVRRWIKLGDWTGAPREWSIPVKELVDAGADSVAVLVQGGSPDKPGAILGAAQVPLQ